LKVISEAVPVPNLPNKVLGVTWDSNINDRNIFIVFDQHDIFTYVYVKYSIDGRYKFVGKVTFGIFFGCFKGSSVQKVGQTSLVSKQIPLLMYSGEVMSATSGGQLTQLMLNTHDSLQVGLGERDQTIMEANFNKQIALHR
jgi:hypothetical protein